MVAIGLGGAIMLPTRHGALAAEPTMADVRSMLADRSPGIRGAGALYQTKAAFDDVGGVPRERVLDQIRDRPAGPVADGGVPGAAPGAAEPLGNPANPGFADGDPAQSVAGGPSFADSGFILPGGGAAVGPGSGGGGTPSGPTPPAASPVPEPATWLSMLIGLLAGGLMLRRRGHPTALLR